MKNNNINEIKNSNINEKNGIKIEIKKLKIIIHF